MAETAVVFHPNSKIGLVRGRLIKRYPTNELGMQLVEIEWGGMRICEQELTFKVDEDEGETHVCKVQDVNEQPDDTEGVRQCQQ